MDLRNRLNGDTPLHIAVRQRWEGSEGLRLWLGSFRPRGRVGLIIVNELLEAGADTKYVFLRPHLERDLAYCHLSTSRDSITTLSTGQVN